MVRPRAPRRYGLRPRLPPAFEAVASAAAGRGQPPSRWANSCKTWYQGQLVGAAPSASKRDGAENTNIEAIKGGYSGAFKRAAVKWGIGRYLYGLGTEWHDTVEHYSAKEPGVDYIKINVKGKWVFVRRPSLPIWAMPEPPKDVNWSSDQAAFCAELTSHGVKYDDVAEWCSSMGRHRPSRMDSEGRSRLLDYINSEEGMRRYSAWRNE